MALRRGELTGRPAIDSADIARAPGPSRPPAGLVPNDGGVEIPPTLQPSNNAGGETGKLKL